MATKSSLQPLDAYSGIDNLEVMQEAVNYNRYLLQLVQRCLRPGMRVADFGAGTGQFTLPLHAASCDVTAVEPDAALRGRIAAQGVTTLSNAAELPDTTFDVIYSLNVLEHIDDDVGALRELHRALKPQSLLLIYVPAFAILYTSMDAKVGHLRRYRRATLAQAARAAGFTIERLAYVDCLGFFATLVFKLIGQRDGHIDRAALRAYDRWIFPLSRLLDFLTRRWFGKNLLLIARK